MQKVTSFNLMYSYVVSCKFSDAHVAQQWIDWLTETHIQDVLDAGAISAEIFKIDGELRFDIRYLFDSRLAFEEYEKQHAPRLREDGLKNFPLDLGLEYSRSSGESIAKWSR